MSSFKVYILECVAVGANENRGKVYYYTGMTGRDLASRISEHRSPRVSGWCRRWKRYPKSLGYFEVVETKEEALEREQEIKNWPREKKAKKVNEFKNLNSEHPLVKFWREEIQNF